MIEFLATSAFVQAFLFTGVVFVILCRIDQMERDIADMRERIKELEARIDERLEEADSAGSHNEMLAEMYG